jgi:RNA polymerase sigma-70 factor (ECF subfamily)
MSDLENLETRTDEELMNLCVEGSEEAFRELMRRFHPRIVNVVYRYINDPIRAEEIAQEVFVRVYVHRERYRRTARFSTWIFTIALNLTKNEIRHRVRHSRLMSLDALTEMGASVGFFLRERGKGPDEKLEERELQEVVNKAIVELPPKYRDAVVLRDLEGLSYEEVSDILSIPGGTVRSRINRGRLILKKKLEPFVSMS